MTLYRTPPCTVCEEISTLQLDGDKLARWRGGQFAQDVWPELSDSERELIITGTHPKCWEEMFRDVE